MKSQRQQVENRLEALIRHRLKWANHPDQRSARWRATVLEQRTRIRRLLRDSPSLTRVVGPMSQDVYGDAVRAAVIETGLSESAVPQTLPHMAEQIFERELTADDLTRKKQP